ncbi:MAG: D-alanyl-D-alanine endopeptidase [Proteobacteria bacterium]|nr:D-alanyl-D-alanine endopeptidase [Pseudomonadota bacterium]MBU1570390.1 D-alanyl-D-alanine endopeptidase [Pseudomonadota bacterium]
MVRRYGIVIVSILLSVWLLDVQGAIGFSKSPKSTSANKKHSSVKAIRTPRNLVLRSASVLVKDQRTGELLIQKQTEAVLPIASITKLMTAMVVLDARIDLKESITIEPTDVDTLLYSPSRLPVGTRLSRENALLLALMASENRAANALGRTYPGGLEAFVNAMNAKAKSLGLFKTRFEDTAGLSSGNTSSAMDLARMVDAAYHYPLVREFTTREDATIFSGRRTLEFHNTNRLIQNPRWQIGLSKTGFTNEAGRCLVMQVSVARRPLLIVLLDAQGKLTRIGDANRIKRWMEEQSLAQQKRQG